MRLLFTCLVILLSLVSCSKEEKPEFNPEAVALNNKACELFQKTWGGSSITDSCIALLDSAIAIDSNYAPAYLNKATFLANSKRYMEAIKAFDKITKLKINFAEGFVGQALFYEKLGMMDEANQNYKKGLACYQIRLKDAATKQDSLNPLINILFIKGLTKDKQKAIAGYDSLVSRSPEDENLKYYKVMFDSLDHDEFINQL